MGSRRFFRWVLLAALFCLAFVVFSDLDIYEWFYSFSRSREGWELDELVLVLPALLVVLLILLLLQGRDLRKALGDLRDKEDALGEAYLLNAGILAHAPMGVMVFSLEGGQCVLANTTMSDLLGGTVDQLRGWNLGRIDSWRESGLLQSVEEVAATGAEKRVCVSMVSTFGRAVRLECLLSVFSHGRMGKRFLLVIAQDISERERFERELLKTARAAEAADRAKSEFLANMSHEIRTPLNGIVGSLQLVSDSGLDEEQAECLRIARDSCDQFLSVINDLLDLTKVETGSTESRETVFTAEGVFESVASVVRRQQEFKGLTLDFRTTTEAAGVFAGDEGRVRRVLLSLVGNAVKFTDQGGISVAVRAEPGGDGAGSCRLLFEVADTGIGIPRDKLERIFEPFTQVDGSTTRKYGGAGLGLSIAKRFLEILGGSITVESEEGKGSRFVFEVPVRSVDGFAPGQAEGDAEAARALNKILLAEDELLTRRVLQSLLSKWGYTVVTAANGQEALEALRREDFQMVFMDIGMPVMDGLEATRAIRNGQAGRDKAGIPIVALTVHVLAGDEEEFAKAGIDDCLAKPVVRKEFMKVMARLGREAGKGGGAQE